jgi:hypothetical protein
MPLNLTPIDLAMVTAIAAAVSALAASVGAISAARALLANNRIQKHALNAVRLDQGERLMDRHLAELIQLHGRSLAQITATGLTNEEFLYLMHSFSAGDIYYNIGNDTELTLYRRNLLKQEKVRNAWTKLLKGVFINSDGKFARLVDEHLAKEYR